MTSRKRIYLDRSIHYLCGHLALITSQKMLDREMRKIKVPPREWLEMPTGSTVATVKQLTSGSDGLITMVLMPDRPDYSGIRIASFLAHEAVHVWQYHLQEIGDIQDHSREFEAYAIQNIFETLLTAYGEQTGRL